MGLQENMFSEIDQWHSSGLTKQSFLQTKAYSHAKFNYWLLKWKQSQISSSSDNFWELSFSEQSIGKVLEIETPSGLKIIVFG